jgi:hypothetical protein
MPIFCDHHSPADLLREPHDEANDLTVGSGLAGKSTVSGEQHSVFRATDPCSGSGRAGASRHREHRSLFLRAGGVENQTGNSLRKCSSPFCVMHPNLFDFFISLSSHGLYSNE